MTLEQRRALLRIVAVAIASGVLAFCCSYLVSSTYQSSTRLVIHGLDATFLSSSGQSQDKQPSITDPQQAQSLADTYGSMATSRALAVSVVDDLRLDWPSQDRGFVHQVSAAAAWLYRCTRAFVTSGFCAAENRREKAVADVQTGTSAQQLGSTAGPTAGQPGSYVLEITASGDSGAQAQRITNAVADELVSSSAALVRKSTEDYIQRVQQRLDGARSDVERKSAAVTAFEMTHNVSAADQQAVATATGYDNLKADLNTARADLADTQAQLDSINASIAKTSATVTSDEKISTGRSDTSVTTDQSNPVYTDLLTQRSQTEAKITGLQARVATLQDQVAKGAPSALSGTLADLVNLQDDLTAAQKVRDDLSTSLAEAQTQVATAAPDLTRLDSAGRPAYPTSPKRYLYLLIGLVLGVLAGAALTWRAGRRAPRPGPQPPDDAADADGVAPDAGEQREFEDELLGDPFPVDDGTGAQTRSVRVVPRNDEDGRPGEAAAACARPVRPVDDDAVD